MIAKTFEEAVRDDVRLATVDGRLCVMVFGVVAAKLKDYNEAMARVRAIRAAILEVHDNPMRSQFAVLRSRF